MVSVVFQMTGLDLIFLMKIITIFLQPTDKEEIANIISSLNSNKASGPNSIYTL